MATLVEPATDYNVNETMKVVDIPLKDIFSDSEFNIRGIINMPDVVDLARNINTHGLQQPIAVQPYNKEGYKYRIVLGHRRFAAHQYLQRETIPAIIKHNLSEIQALALNFNENVNRKDLNVLEEAHGVKRFLDAGETIESTAKLVNKGKRWVGVRFQLLKMPEPIQHEAAAGYLTQSQIEELASLDDPDLQLATVRRIKEAILNGQQRLPKVKEKKKNPTVMKRRKPDEMYEMVNHIIDETGVTNPFTRAIAWCNGEINDLDLYRDMVEYFREKGIAYSPPMEVAHLIQLKPIGV